MLVQNDSYKIVNRALSLVFFMVSLSGFSKMILNPSVERFILGFLSVSLLGMRVLFLVKPVAGRIMGLLIFGFFVVLLFNNLALSLR